MQKIAAFIVKKRKLLLVVMLALAVVCAALMPFVGINTDMTKYLPDSSQMKIGMDRMNEAFPDVAETYTIRVMFRELDARDKLAIREQLAEIPNVDSVAYEPDSDDYNRGDATLYKLTTQYDYNSDEEAQIERDVADRFADYDVAVRSDDTSTPGIPPIVFILSIVLVTTILLIACPSYFEPVLFLLTIGVAVLLNQGTNIILGETSDVTASISAIFQLALSMDYSIILMNRYRQELQADPDREAAMTRALTAAFGSITGSSVTTIVGLLMLVFMRFKIGMDLGIVLAKGVLCSLLCVFTVLPGLILWADKLVRKTTKKPRAPKRERRSVLAALGRFSYRWRGAIAAAFVLLFGGRTSCNCRPRSPTRSRIPTRSRRCSRRITPSSCCTTTPTRTPWPRWRTGSRPTRTSRAPCRIPPRSAGSTPPRRWPTSSARSMPASRSVPICWA